MNVFSTMNFPLSTALAISHTFWYVDFLSSFSSTNVFFISLETSSLVHGLLRRMLFSFQVYWVFPVIFLLLISSFISLWSEKLHKLSSLKFVGVCYFIFKFLAQSMGYFWYLFSWNLQRKWIVLSLGEVLCTIWLDPIG